MTHTLPPCPMGARNTPARQRLARFLRLSRRLADTGARAFAADDHAALQRQATQHLLVLRSIELQRAAMAADSARPLNT